MTRWKNPLLWFRGLLAGFIGGGAGAVTSGFIAVGQTPESYNLKDGLTNLLVMIGGSFLVVGILNACAYLQKSPLPELEEYDTEHVTKQLNRSDIGLDNPKDP